MSKIELEQVEFSTLCGIINDPNKIIQLPKGFYEKIMDYMVQEEMYEHIPKLQSIKHKISDKTLDEILANSQPIPNEEALEFLKNKHPEEYNALIKWLNK